MAGREVRGEKGERNGKGQIDLPRPWKTLHTLRKHSGQGVLSSKKPNASTGQKRGLVYCIDPGFLPKAFWGMTFRLIAIGP